MSRTLPAAVDTQLDDPFLPVVWFVEFDFDTAPLYVHTDIGDITVLSNTWMGTGGLGQFSPIEENSNSDSPGVKFRLQLTDESAGSIYEEITQQDFYQRPVIVYVTTRDAVTGDLTADPTEVGRFKCDIPEITYGERASFVDLIAESEWMDGQRANGELYSDAQLQSEQSGDLGFKYLAAMKNAKIVWGARTTTSLGGGGGGQPDQPRSNPRPGPNTHPYR